MHISCLDALKSEMQSSPVWRENLRHYYLGRGFAQHLDEPNVIARAYAVAELFTCHEKYVYDNDLIAGSVRGLLAQEIPVGGMEPYCGIAQSYGFRSFVTNADHFAPDFRTLLYRGICGTFEAIAASRSLHAGDVKREQFLKAAEISMRAFSRMIHQYGDAAAAKGLTVVAETCYAVESEPPRTFRQALQLVWLTHVAFLYEGRYAMALGRLDQYLYRFYCADCDNGLLTPDEARALIACTLYKIGESRYDAGDDVVNIAIGGVRPEDGTDAVNALSYLILDAVGACGIPGPNLSARLHKNTAPEFLDACLQVIGIGLGYPALMNDDINIPALHRHGYAIEDCRDYCMVGCIENFIQGKQPPWSDGRYNTPKYVELALNNGVCMMTGVQLGPKTGAAETIVDMDGFLCALEQQMAYGAALYMMRFRNENEHLNPESYAQPFLSCFCDCCIDRGLDINDGGARYPSVHGAGCMGIATVADSLAAIQKYVYQERRFTLAELRDLLAADCKGHPEIRKLLLRAPKYGNDDDFVDQYAVWFVEAHERIFSKYHTRDGGAIYTIIASNVSNIPAGREVAATPDGRRRGEPLSDAASPMHGMDKAGPTAVIQSCSKPDYTLVSCGTVLNQKYSPEMFHDAEKRTRLAAMIRAYFLMGGQEIQINSVSREILSDAMEHPQNYSGLVVRVSGFSAYYTNLGRDVQEDILKRTEHE